MKLDANFIARCLDQERLPNRKLLSEAGITVAIGPDVLDIDVFDQVMKHVDGTNSVFSFAHAEWRMEFVSEPISSINGLWTAFGAVYPEDAIGAAGNYAIFQPGADDYHFIFFYNNAIDDEFAHLIMKQENEFREWILDESHQPHKRANLMALLKRYKLAFNPTT